MPSQGHTSESLFHGTGGSCCVLTFSCVCGQRVRLEDQAVSWRGDISVNNTEQTPFHPHNFPLGKSLQWQAALFFCVVLPDLACEGCLPQHSSDQTQGCSTEATLGLRIRSTRLKGHVSSIFAILLVLVVLFATCLSLEKTVGTLASKTPLAHVLNGTLLLKTLLFFVVLQG